MKNDYRDEITVRTDDLEGVEEWHWVTSDTGGYGNENDGPRNDWLSSHKHKYFKHLKKFDTIVTAGTCCGMYTRFYSQMFKTVYAFEPDPRNFYCMSLNNPFRNVIKINAALGDTHKMIYMSRNDTNVGAIGVQDEEPEKCIIPVLRLDDFKFDTLDVIQLDCEGQEYHVLNGAEKTIEKHRPIIIVEALRSHPIFERCGYQDVDRSKADAIFVSNKIGA